MHWSGHRICAGIALLASSCVLPAAASNVHSAPLEVTHDKPFIMVMVNGIGAHLTNDEKRAHLIDLKRGHLIDQVCVQEILPPEK